MLLDTSFTLFILPGLPLCKVMITSMRKFQHWSFPFASPQFICQPEWSFDYIKAQSEREKSLSLSGHSHVYFLFPVWHFIQALSWEKISSLLTGTSFIWGFVLYNFPSSPRTERTLQRKCKLSYDLPAFRPHLGSPYQENMKQQRQQWQVPLSTRGVHFEGCFHM